MVDTINNSLIENLYNMDFDQLLWQDFREGIKIFPLYSTSTASAALLQYNAGASVPLHEHEGYEHIFVLKGSQQDERGKYNTGDLLINKPFSRHSVQSMEGCVVLAIWEKPVRFVQE